MRRYIAIATVLAAALLLSLPNAHADVVYTLSTDYSGAPGFGAGNFPAGSTINWQFEVPSLLTAPTTVTSFTSTSLGPGFSGCSVLDAKLPIPAPSPYTSLVITDFTGSCGISSVGSFFFGDLNPDNVHIANQFSGVVVGTLTIATPEPTSLLLLGTGALGLLGPIRRKLFPRK